MRRGGNGDTNVEKRLVDPEGEGEGGKNGSMEHMHDYMGMDGLAGMCCVRQGPPTGSVIYLAGWDGLVAEEEEPEGGGICTPVAIHVDVWQESAQCRKAVIFQLKIN